MEIVVTTEAGARYWPVMSGRRLIVLREDHKDSIPAARLEEHGLEPWLELNAGGDVLAELRRRWERISHG